jgi:hypothetical protein
MRSAPCSRRHPDARWFQGEVDADGFKVRPALDPRWSFFVPVVTGRIYPDPQGSRTVVSTRLPMGSMLLPLMWLSIPGSAAIAEAPRLGAAALLTALVYGIVLILFWRKAIPQERMLRQIFGKHRSAS